MARSDRSGRASTATVLRWAMVSRWASAGTREAARLDPVLAMALFANDPANLPELRLAAHAEAARHFYPQPPRHDAAALARLHAELHRRFGGNR